jgi:hypothetical protein
MFSIFTLPPSVSLNLNHFPSDNIFLQTGPNAGTIFYFIYLFIYLFCESLAQEFNSKPFSTDLWETTHLFLKNKRN